MLFMTKHSTSLITLHVMLFMASILHVSNHIIRHAVQDGHSTHLWSHQVQIIKAKARMSHVTNEHIRFYERRLHTSSITLYVTVLSSHHLSLNRESRWGTTDDFATDFLHFSLFSNAFWDLANSRPVHSLMLSSHLFLCLPCLFPSFTVSCKMVLARPDERET